MVFAGLAGGRGGGAGCHNMGIVHGRGGGKKRQRVAGGRWQLKATARHISEKIERLQNQ